MAKVVIMGARIGGITQTCELRKKLGKNQRDPGNQ